MRRLLIRTGNYGNCGLIRALVIHILSSAHRSKICKKHLNDSNKITYINFDCINNT